jgi:hypothetical protein
MFEDTNLPKLLIDHGLIQMLALLLKECDELCDQHAQVMNEVLFPALDIIIDLCNFCEIKVFFT